MKKFFYKRLSELVKSRLFVMLGGVVLLFSIIGARLFMLQILDGEEYQQAAKASIMQTLSIPASRGTIYDRYGRPLATNQAAFSVKFDDSVKLSLTNRNKQLSDAVKTCLEAETISPIPFPLQIRLQTDLSPFQPKMTKQNGSSP